MMLKIQNLHATVYGQADPQEDQPGVERRMRWARPTAPSPRRGEGFRAQKLLGISLGSVG